MLPGYGFLKITYEVNGRPVKERLNPWIGYAISKSMMTEQMQRTRQPINFALIRVTNALASIRIHLMFGERLSKYYSSAETRRQVYDVKDSSATVSSAYKGTRARVPGVVRTSPPLD